MKSVACFFAFSTFLFAGERPVVTLWPSGAPGSEGKTAKELIEPPEKDRAFTRVSSIHSPSLTVYLPSPEKATGTAIVIAPGGGHRILAMHEGYDIGEWLASKGIAGFVLKYRLAKEPGSTYKVEVHALQDAQRAIRLVRSRAQEWRVDPKRVGIMGFSAGGEVALRASTSSSEGDTASEDPINKQKSRPDFQVLVYPGIRTVSLDVPKDTPPTFLICTHDDKSPAEMIPNLYLALLKAGIPAEMHIYARGGHGYGIRQRPLPVSSWHARFEEWLADQGFAGKR